ncbi:uncharacterized protein LOC126555298 isoform X3 [Aphis gossypii]|uniref:uncharacterized protein LOC126555298 isoform X3 n=1 Tax=Aphis gossypii TaxID=80765 RepID=UPI002159313E|nr:uncharacterized protein LOC126555298 isoform X3 [Aphis gossypii]
MTILTSLAEELHGPARKIFPRRSVVTRFKDDLWQADLIDMQPHSRQNNGFKFILIIIDTFTKYVWVEALKNKTAKECTKGIIKILKKNQPKLLQTDNGTEFYNNEFQSSWNWINSIFKLVYNYNNTKHSTIKCSPHEARINPVTIKEKHYKLIHQINLNLKLMTK